MRDGIVFVTKKEEDGDGGEREREGMGLVLPNQSGRTVTGHR